MDFGYSEAVRADFPELASRAVLVSSITPTVDVASVVSKYNCDAISRLGSRTESDLPEIQAWRRTFAKMGLKPTQYRCASEALLRRFRKEGHLPKVHPLVDICNAISLAFAIPIAVFDVADVTGRLEVRRASGFEVYETFSGETEAPEPNEIIFADDAGYAHARRWTNRQSRRSAVSDETETALIVSEAMHTGAKQSADALIAEVEAAIFQIWDIRPLDRAAFP